MKRCEDERSEEGDYPRDELEESVVESRCESVMDEYPEIQGICNAREAMEKLPEEEKEKILQQVEVFRVEKRAFDREVSKWDDQGNEVILLAKNMCTIMMDMTDSISRVVQRTVPLQSSNDCSAISMEETRENPEEETRENPEEENREISGEENQEILSEENRETPAEEVEGAGAVAAELGELLQLIKERRNNR